MLATRKNITLECGADFVMLHPFTDENGEPKDLTGATVDAQLRQFAQDTEYFLFTAYHNGAGGKIWLAMPHELTADISYLDGVYDVYVNYPEGGREKVLYGNAHIEPHVVKPVDGTILYMIGIEEYAVLPEIGEADRLYFCYDDRKVYRWNGTNYIGTAVGNGIQRIDYLNGGTYRMVFDDGTYFDFESVPRLMGMHNSAQAYQKLDIVHASNGATYIALIPVPASTAITDTDYWMQITPKTLTIGTVTEVGPGYTSASIGGTADAPVLNLDLSRGESGNETIDDSKGAGDTDYVWSADKLYQETSIIFDAIDNIHLEEYRPGYIGGKSINSSGTVYSAEKWGLTKFIFVKYVTQIVITLKTGFRGYYYTYDKNKSFIARSSISGSTIEVPSDVWYMRFSVTNEQNYDATAYAGSVILKIFAKSFEKKPIDGTPFYYIEADNNNYHWTYKKINNVIEPGNVRGGYSPVMKCPKILGFYSATSNLYIYIGDMVNGEFVPDFDNFTFGISSSTNTINFIGTNYSNLIETDGTKYFYYKIIDPSLETVLIGCDEDFPQNKYAYTQLMPFGINSSGALDNGKKYSSLILPHDSFFALTGKVGAVRLWQDNNVDGTTVISYWNNKIFGYTPKDGGPVGITIEDSDDPLANIKLYCSKQPTVTSEFNNMSKRFIDNVINKFRFKIAKDLPMANSNYKYYAGKTYQAIPYSSAYKEARHPFFEISPHTFINAANDEYSIFYETSLTNTRAAFYGFACSSFGSLLAGYKYPTGIDAMFFDGSIDKKFTGNGLPGNIFVNYILGHCLYLSSFMQDGYTIYEATKLGCMQTIHDTPVNPVERSAYYSLGYGRRFVLEMTPFERYYDDYYTDIDNAVITNGSVRPWKGDKCVYGSWDKEKGRIKATVHYPEEGTLSNIYLKLPDLSVITIPVTDETVVDIGEYVTQDGTYQLYSDYDATVEQFRFFDKGTVVLSFENDVAQFSDPDVEYCYCRYTGDLPEEYSRWNRGGNRPITIGTGVKYKGLPNLITTIHAAIARDTTEGDSWGKYSCLLAFQNVEPDDDRHEDDEVENEG